MGANRADRETTLETPADALATQPQDLLGLTVLWHPNRQRIGEQAVLQFQGDRCEVHRNAPDFQRAGSDIGQALDHQGISRTPIGLLRNADGSITVHGSASRMHFEVDGQVVAGDGPEGRVLGVQQLARGVVLRLGSSVLLCLGYIGLVPSPQRDSALAGVGRAMARVRSAIAQVAGTGLPVLILGETGTGKELVAQAIHAASTRQAQTLVSVNMATLGESLAAADLFGACKGAYTGALGARKGLFAEAHGGTLFLDEIGDTPVQVQPMLLRALETGEYRPLGSARTERADVRLIAATDRDLSAAGFNQPLLRRLEAFVIAIAPLRERREDIGVLIAQGLARLQGSDLPAAELPVSVIQALCMHDWPGNVRQLLHYLQRLVLAVQAGEVPELPGVETVPAAAAEAVHSIGPAPVAPAAPVQGAAAPRYRTPASVSEAEMLEALETHQWCVRKAAEHLSLSRPSFYALLYASPTIRRVEAIPLDEIDAVVRRAPADPAYWASQLRTPRETLRRHVQQLGLLAR
ncbi:TPA: sigma-54-dependent Fis family transcriptional regulator [Stenotrophomonas maltophilia]|nr:sigma-54-dependent Fis family transcriptional regulator [Stenotrophomonas maltophilia]HDS1024261.1 sigma-54-dependent Fis family transcriptional regulator [Stenotrophomonas maltophilia]HDS1028729.1 sigma-54-dependent Fis family transcriptional regulator [Stenotrophomonas maltophilia]HDS1033117.1 sigma-54-dependent Fis family transcriptional regulator [Stenotrophomonas maltophilia]